LRFYCFGLVKEEEDNDDEWGETDAIEQRPNDVLKICHMGRKMRRLVGVANIEEDVEEE